MQTSVFLSDRINTHRKETDRLLTYNKTQRYEPMRWRRWHTKCVGLGRYWTRAAMKNSRPCWTNDRLLMSVKSMPSTKWQKKQSGSLQQ